MIATKSFRPKAKPLCMVLFTLLAISTSAVMAQTTTFTYQGRLTDAGNPANGNYDLQFKLFDALAGGAQQGATLVRTPVTASAGNFAATLDFGANVFTGADRYLEISVRPAGSANAYTVLAPRQPITSTPYAQRSLTAGNASQLGGVDAARFVQTDAGGNVSLAGGFTLTGVGNGLTFPDGTTQTTAAVGGGGSGGVSGTGTVNTVPLWTGATALSNSIITQASGGIGIGTVAPLTAGIKLEINGATLMTPGGLGGKIQFGTPSSETGLSISNSTTMTRADIRFDSTSLKLVAVGAGLVPPSTNGVVIHTSGNVGIGTTSPTIGKLNVLASTANQPAIYGESLNRGVWGKSTGSRGVYGESASGEGVYGISTSNYGVSGVSTTSNGVSGFSLGGGIGVFGESAQYEGVRGLAHDINHGGVVGIHDGGGIGIYGTSAGAGVQGESTSPTGFGGVFSNSGGGKALRVVGTGSIDVIEINGGGDFSEKFDVSSSADAGVEPAVVEARAGLLVSIDARNPGKLAVSRRAYDRRIAGVISGAGDIKPGIVMGQAGSIANGKHPVALTGRVYCWADASNGRIKPGDLLTSSALAGHAMKVTNHVKAKGAVIGKAMTVLKSGRGLVLVLVSLQ